MRQADREAIYCQLGEGIHFPAQVTDGNNDEEDEDIMTELYFIPANGESCKHWYTKICSGSLSNMDGETDLFFLYYLSLKLIVEVLYNAMSQCAVLHPDADADEEDFEEGDEEWYANPSDEAELNEVQRAALDHLANVFQPPVNGKQTHENDDGAFEDAMEEE